MKGERNFNILVGTSSYTKEFDDLRDIILSISLVVVHLYLSLGNEFWNACFKEEESIS